MSLKRAGTGIATVDLLQCATPTIPGYQKQSKSLIIWWFSICYHDYRRVDRRWSAWAIRCTVLRCYRRWSASWWRSGCFAKMPYNGLKWRQNCRIVFHIFSDNVLRASPFLERWNVHQLLESVYRLIVGFPDEMFPYSNTKLYWPRNRN